VFKFYVNSCYKVYGRCLEVEMWDSNTAIDSLVGFGIIDLDPYLNSLVNKPAESKGPLSAAMRCFMSY